MIFVVPPAVYDVCEELGFDMSDILKEGPLPTNKGVTMADRMTGGSTGLAKLKRPRTLTGGKRSGTVNKVSMKSAKKRHTGATNYRKNLTRRSS